MTERFERIYQLPDNIYFDNSPVIISAGVMLRDTDSGSIIVQMKFHSVTTRIINAVKVSLSFNDVSGEILPSVDNYQYLDLCVNCGEKFGDKKAIIVESQIARSFSLEKISVVFSDGEIWTNETPMIVLPLPEPISNGLPNHELIAQYQSDTSAQSVWVPVKSNDLWCCSCGEWNSVRKCSRCGCNYDHVFSCYDIELLQKEVQCHLAEEKERKSKRKKIFAIVFAVFVLFASVLGVSKEIWNKKQMEKEAIQQELELQYVSESAEMITNAIKKALTGTVNLEGEDRNHYSLSFSIKNDSSVLFVNYEIITTWGTETVSAKKERWLPGETWEVKLIIPEEAAQGDALQISLNTSYETYDVQKSDG